MDKRIVRAIEKCKKMVEDDSMSFDQMKVAHKYFCLTWRLLPPPPPPLNPEYEALRLRLLHFYEKLRFNCLSRHKIRLPFIS